MKITETDFDWEGAEAAKQKAIDQVEENNETWGITALDIAVTWLEGQPKGALFCTADLYEHVDEPREPRAWGALMRTLARLKLCEKTDRTKPSGLKRNHHRPLAIWRKT